MGRDLLNAVVGDIADNYAGLSGRLNVHIVGTHTVTDYDLALAEGADYLCREIHAADENTFGLFAQLQGLGPGKVVGINEVTASLADYVVLVACSAVVVLYGYNQEISHLRFLHQSGLVR